METIRDLHDQTGCPVLLCGKPEIYEKLGFRHAGDFSKVTDQLAARVVVRRDLTLRTRGERPEPFFSADDIRRLIKQSELKLHVDPTAVKWLQNRASTLGTGGDPADQGDIQLFAAVMRGEHLINGFRNQDIRRQLFKPTRNGGESSRQRARVSRLLKQLHIHGLIAKIPRSRRWRVTHHGHIIMTTVLILHHQHYAQLLTRQAA